MSLDFEKTVWLQFVAHLLYKDFAVSVFLDFSITPQNKKTARM